MAEASDHHSVTVTVLHKGIHTVLHRAVHIHPREVHTAVLQAVTPVEVVSPEVEVVVSPEVEEAAAEAV